MALTKYESTAPAATLDDQIALDLAAAERLAAAISRDWEAHIESLKRVSVQRHHRASSLGQKCDRRLYHDIADWDKKPPVPTQVQQYFARGNAHEPIIYQTLAELGYRVVGEQRDWYDSDLRLAGKIEGHIVEKESGRPILAEFKSSADLGLVRCETLAMLRTAARGLMYYTQLQTYLYLFELYAALLLVWDIGKWRPVPIAVPLDIDFASAMIERVKRINRDLDAGDPPAYIEDVRECRRCPHFGRACNPPLAFGEGVLYLVNEVLLRDIERAESIEAAGREWNYLIKRVRDQLRPMGERVVIGDFLVSNEDYDRVDYKVPPHLRAKFKALVRRTRTVWKRLPDKKVTP
uniref:PD-(D/E)XK nuclease superfamily protein n=1 Tax=viral metagenome TaxID=1070528 RepID=A0A6M3JCG4_9ZZZZ